MKGIQGMTSINKVKVVNIFLYLRPRKVSFFFLTFETGGSNSIVSQKDTNIIISPNKILTINLKSTTPPFQLQFFPIGFHYGIEGTGWRLGKRIDDLSPSIRVIRVNQLDQLPELVQIVFCYLSVGPIYRRVFPSVL